MSNLLINRTALLALTIGGLFPYVWTGGSWAAPTDTQKTVPGHKSAKAVSTKASASKASESKSTVSKAQAPKAAASNAHKNGSTNSKTDSVHKAAVSDQDADFQLKASFTTSHPADSATNTYGSLGAGDGAPAPVTFERKFDMLVAPKTTPEDAKLDVANAKKGVVDKAAELQAAEASSVDWSGWAGQLADRWFANLKNLEYSSHRGWTTDRPAMIQFTCHADGRITNIVIRQSCGNTPYDNMQIEALKRTIPAPSFPAGTHLTSYTLIQGWEAHPRNPGEQDYKPGSFGKNMPAEKVPLKKPAAPAGSKKN